MRGKNDPTDAEDAARTVLAGEANAIPKAQSGVVEAMRAVTMARRSAVKAKTQAINQLRALLVTAPASIRATLWKVKPEQCGARCARSGTTIRHRLNRGGDRAANNALWTMSMVRMRSDPRTRAYVARRTAEGLFTKETQRCRKRYIVRELYPLILADLADSIRES